MIYDNCEKYIELELMKIFPFSIWREKKIIIYGLDVLSKTIISILNNNGIEDISIIDNKRYGDKWADIEIKLPSAVLELEEASDRLVIIVTPQNRYMEIIREIENINLAFEKNILNLSQIRMSSMPNTILPDHYRTILSLRECQIKQLPILRDFVKFCEDNQLRYFLDYGTLLGAVRHKGFIPWDDDIDVAMPMPDYLKLCELFPRDGKWFFDSIFNETVEDLTASTLSKIKSKEMITEFHTFPLRILTGIGIDIFPLCGYPSDERMQREYMKEFQYWADIWKEKVVIPYGTECYSRKYHYELFEKMNKISLRYDYDTSEFIGPAYFGADCPPAKDNSRAMKKEWYDRAIKMQFEGEYYNVPIGYDLVLKKWYGEYMELPPVEEQVPHDTLTIYEIDMQCKENGKLWI